MGHILEVAIKKSNVKIKTLADRVGCSRQTIYNLYNKIEITDYPLIERIGKAIQYDFSEEIVALKKYREHPESWTDPGEGYVNLPEKKQIAVLEERIKTLEAKNEGWRERYRIQKEKTEAVQDNNKTLKENIILLKKALKEEKKLATQGKKKLSTADKNAAEKTKPASK